MVANLGDVKAARSQLLNDIREVRPTNKDAAKDMQRTLAELRKAQVVASNTGQLYKVDIPDPAVATFLDWDKPLSQQPETVRKAYAKAIAGSDPLSAELLGGLSTPDELVAAGLLPKSKGSQAYATIDKDPAIAAQKLREAGIQGIRYLDGGSRGAGAGTSNFVVFDPSIVKILERNGQPMGLLEVPSK